MFFTPLSKIVWLKLCGLVSGSSIQLIYWFGVTILLFCYSGSVVQFESKYCVAVASSISGKDCLIFVGRRLLCFHLDFKIVISISENKNGIGILMGECFNHIDYFLAFSQY